MKFQLLIFVSKCVNALPRSVRLALGSALGWIWFNVIRFRRDQVLVNLRLAFGEEKTESELRRIAARNFRHYGLTVMEVLQGLSWKQSDYAREVPVEGIENLRAALAKGRGVYGLNCHLGNWEWVIGSVMAQGIPGDVVVKHSKNPSVDAFLRWYRVNMGIGVFYESGTVGEINRSLSQGRLVGFILDQFMGPPIGLPVTFFGKQAGTAIGLALLTEKKAAPIVPMYSYRDDQDRLRTVVEPEIEMPAFSENRQDRFYEKTQLFNDVIERQVRKHPDQWLWLHRRWKAYRGEPRWRPTRGLAPAIAGVIFALLLGCASSPDRETVTGIDLPPDPELSVPDEQTVEAAVPPTTLAPEAAAPVPSPEPEAATEKKSEKKKAIPVKTRPKAALIPRSFKPDQIPFEVGERMILSLNWGALSAGDARLEVREGFPAKGRPTFRLWGHVLSSKLVDAVYHVENTIESFIDKQWLLPYKFLLHMVESAQLKETRASFDHTKNQVHYWAKRVSEKWGNATEDRVDNAYPLARDMFSGLYFARVLDFELGKTVEIPIYENRQNILAVLTPVGNEFVRTKAGAFQCWKIKLSIKVDNVLRPTGDLYMWLSDDSKRYLVKFDAKLKIGSLVGELTSVRERL